MKTPISRRFAAGVALSLLATGTLGAQSARGTFRATPNSGGSSRSAREVREVPVVVVTPNTVVTTTIRTSTLVPSQPVSVVLLPAILMSDGTVIANFGLGFEPVRRACDAAVVVVGAAPTVVAGNGVVISSGTGAVAGSNGVVLTAGNGVVLSQGNVPTFTQPVPNQIAPSQQAVSSNQAQFQVLTTFSQTSCFTRDGTGQFVVVRQ